jgi:hypothetical protein
MILNSRLPIVRLPAAPDVVANAIAEELRSHGCVIRRVAPDVVEFDGPGLFARREQEHAAAAMVTGGAVWLSPAGTEMRVALRIGWPRMVVAAAAGCVVAALNLHPGTRLVLLMVIAAIALANLDAARHAFEEWVHRGLRRV